MEPVMLACPWVLFTPSVAVVPVTPPLMRTVPASGTAGESVRSVSRSIASAREAAAARKASRNRSLRIRATFRGRPPRAPLLQNGRQGRVGALRSQAADLSHRFYDVQTGRLAFLQFRLEHQPARRQDRAEVV